METAQLCSLSEVLATKSDRLSSFFVVFHAFCGFDFCDMVVKIGMQEVVSRVLEVVADEKTLM